MRTEEVKKYVGKYVIVEERDGTLRTGLVNTRGTEYELGDTELPYGNWVMSKLIPSKVKTIVEYNMESE